MQKYFITLTVVIMFPLKINFKMAAKGLKRSEATPKRLKCLAKYGSHLLQLRINKNINQNIRGTQKTTA